MVNHPFYFRFSYLQFYVLSIFSLSIISFASWSVELCPKDSQTCIQVQVNNFENTPLQNMVIYLEPLSGQSVPEKKQAVDINQDSKVFTPYISVSQRSSKVNFVNKDDITHHIYSADSENKFSFKIRSGKTDSSTPFNKTAEIAMGCNIHDWMSGYLLVVDTPYFAKTNEQGLASFTLNELGKYRIVLWHPQIRAEKNRMVIEKILSTGDVITFTLQEKMDVIPVQKSEDFDFLSDY